MARKPQFLAPVASVVLLMSANALAQNKLATARLEPDTVDAGSVATLSVVTNGLAKPELPAVKGIAFYPIGQQESITVTNGSTTQRTTYLYSVQPSQPGDYKIDGIRIGGVQTPVVTLHVRPAGTTAAPQNSRSSGTATGAVGSWPVRASSQPQDLAYMRLRVKNRRIYSGQSVPFTAKAYFRGGTGVVLRGRPEFSSDVFTVSGLDEEPTQRQTLIDGVPYLVVTWRGSLTAAKAGDYSLKMKMPVSMQYREVRRPAASRVAPRRRSLRDLLGSMGARGSSPFGSGSPFADLLDDPMFDRFFDDPFFADFGSPGRIVNRDLDLRALAGTAHVMPLPAEGRPKDFSGAVGRFQLDAKVARSDIQQGEPVDLQFAVSGKGNFGQFSAPTLTPSADWKHYSARGTFRADDKAGTRGTMQYVQPVAARRAGQLELPPLRFSYFDPDQGRYISKTTKPIAVGVAQGDTAAPIPRQTVQASTAAVDGDSRQAGVHSLANGGTPAWIWPSIIALLLLGCVGAMTAVVLRSKRHAERRRRRLSRRELARQRRRMKAALRKGDRVGYLQAGRAAVQERLGASWGVAPESISLRDVETHWPEAPQLISHLLELADEVDYGWSTKTPIAGSDYPSADTSDTREGVHRTRSTRRTGSGNESELSPDFLNWTRRVDEQLSHMEVPS